MLYAALVGATMVLYPPQLNGTMSSLSIHTRMGKVYTNSPRYIVWSRQSLARTTPKIILIGGSNLRAALDRNTVQSTIPGIDVHDMSVGGMNITQMRQIVDLALEVIPGHVVQQTNFVIALSFALFVDNDHHWRVYERLPGTRIEMEMKRFGIYRFEDDGFTPVIPARMISTLGFALWPLFTLSSIRAQAQDHWAAMTNSAAKPTLDLSSPEGQEEAMTLWRRYIGTPNFRLRNEQFDELLKMAARIHQHGATLTLVDMPLPRWFVARSPHDADYQQRKRRYFNEILGAKGSAYINLRDIDKFEDYRDSGHLNRKGGSKFSQRLSDELLKRTATAGQGPK